jgi:hypothetical protein
MRTGQPVRIEDYSHAKQRARACLARHIKENKVPKPDTCDGCGVEGVELRRCIFDPYDALCFSVYCDGCWDDHGVDRMLARRKDTYEPITE